MGFATSPSQCASVGFEDATNMKESWILSFSSYFEHKLVKLMTGKFPSQNISVQTILLFHFSISLKQDHINNDPQTESSVDNWLIAHGLPSVARAQESWYHATANASNRRGDYVCSWRVYLNVRNKTVLTFTVVYIVGNWTCSPRTSPNAQRLICACTSPAINASYVICLFQSQMLATKKIGK